MEVGTALTIGLTIALLPAALWVLSWTYEEPDTKPNFFGAWNPVDYKNATYEPIDSGHTKVCHPMRVNSVWLCAVVETINR